MKKVFISMPMKDRMYSDIVKDMKHKMLILNDGKLRGREYKPINSVQKDIKNMNPVKCLAKSISKMADADLVYFVKGWERARGCRIEYEIARQYGLEIAEEGYL